MYVAMSDASQRSGPLAGLASLLDELGQDSDRLFSDIPIDLRRLTPETRVPFATALVILERAAAATGCEHLGLLLGARYRWGDHGILQRFCSFAPTLQQALLDYVAFQATYSSGATSYLIRFGQDFAAGFGSFDRSSPASRQLYDIAIAVAASFVRELTRGEVEPAEILLCHRSPKDARIYQQILKAPVRFNQNQCCLVLPAAQMGTRLQGFDPDLRERALGELLRDAAFDRISARLRRIIRPQLLESDPTMIGAARALGIHQRTLRRQLAAEGLTFEAVRDQVRFVLARELLELTDLSIGEVSDAVAFSSHAAFVRAFRRWSGMTPTAWRIGKAA
jgi:AraC-like DNA-binding protein